MDSIYREKNTRTYQDYRSSGMFMSSRNAVLYSDTYDPKEYIQALCNSAFGGLLWCPEVREAHSAEDFFHRLQTVILSPQAMVNAWYLQYAPWLQFDRGKNERGEFLEEPIPPCGACRQVMLETEKRFKRPMRILLSGEKGIYELRSVGALLPLSFDASSML